ncbi:hypothetical protein Trisim1_003008 [Trichoderma cf. simile WF8]
MGSLSKDKSSKRKSPLDEEAYYLEVMDILRSLPESTHPVWADLEEELEESPTSQRSKSLLYQKLKKACAEEEFDWRGFDFIKTACENRPNMIQHKDAAALLYKLMGVHGSDWRFKKTKYLYSTAFFKDQKSAESVFLFLGLLSFVQRSALCKNPTFWYLALRSKCEEVEKRLEKNRGAPKMRQFMEHWGEIAGNNSENDGEGSNEEDEAPNQKRRCIKAEK